MGKRLKKKLISKAIHNPVLIMADIMQKASIRTPYKLDYNSYIKAANKIGKV